MRTKTGIGMLVAASLALTPLIGLAKGPQNGSQGNRAQVEQSARDLDRDRVRDRDRIDDQARDRDRSRDQDRLHAPDSAKLGDKAIYGQKLMTVQERIQYREQLQTLGANTKEGTKFIAQHRDKMQKRAKEKGVDLDE